MGLLGWAWAVRGHRWLAVCLDSLVTPESAECMGGTMPRRSTGEDDDS